jgi:hypothetical protein
MRLKAVVMILITFCFSCGYHAKMGESIKPRVIWLEMWWYGLWLV